jgi:hypothetical protein
MSVQVMPAARVDFHNNSSGRLWRQDIGIRTSAELPGFPGVAELELADRVQVFATCRRCVLCCIVLPVYYVTCPAALAIASVLCCCSLSGACVLGLVPVCVDSYCVYQC